MDMLWVNQENRRFYNARLGVDLFGECFLEKITGSMDSDRGKRMFVAISDYNEGRKLLDIIAKTRVNHGYKEVSK